MILLELDVATAAHAAHAIARWQADLRRDGVRWPADLERLRAMFRAMSAQDGSSPTEAVELPETHSVAPLTLTLDHAADLLELSRSTVKRLVRTGQLPAVKVGDRTLVRKADLEEFVATLPAVHQEAS